MASLDWRLSFAFTRTILALLLSFCSFLAIPAQNANAADSALKISGHVDITKNSDLPRSKIAPGVYRATFTVYLFSEGYGLEVHYPENPGYRSDRSHQYKWSKKGAAHTLSVSKGEVTAAGFASVTDNFNPVFSFSGEPVKFALWLSFFRGQEPIDSVPRLFHDDRIWTQSSPHQCVATIDSEKEGVLRAVSFYERRPSLREPSAVSDIECAVYHAHEVVPHGTLQIPMAFQLETSLIVPQISDKTIYRKTDVGLDTANAAVPAEEVVPGAVYAFAVDEIAQIPDDFDNYSIHLDEEKTYQTTDARLSASTTIRYRTNRWLTVPEAKETRSYKIATARERTKIPIQNVLIIMLAVGLLALSPIFISKWVKTKRINQKQTTGKQ